MEDSQESKTKGLDPNTVMVFVLKRDMLHSWSVCSHKGHKITETFVGNREAAEIWARAYVSSWSGAFLRIEEDEQAKRG